MKSVIVELYYWPYMKILIRVFEWIGDFLTLLAVLRAASWLLSEYLPLFGVAV
jgi:hypothetical protein